MNEFKLPHVEDLRIDATLIRGLQEDFKAIEQEDTDLRKLINNKHDDLSKQLTQLNQRLDELMNGGGM